MIYIEKLAIKHFKSIEDETISFNKGLNILVGPNNAGKTNIIEAIDIVLGDIYLPRFEPTTDHFYLGDESKEIIIEIELKGDGLKQIFSGLTNDEITIRYKFANKNGIFQIKHSNQWAGDPNRPFMNWWDLDKRLFFLRVKSLRNIMEIAPIRWKSPLRYFKEIIIKKAPEEKLKEVITDIDTAKNKLSDIGEVKDIVSNLLKISKEQIDIKDIQLSPASTKYSDILNEMKVMIDDGYISEVTKKGLGAQNSIIIALFRVMAKYIRDEEKKFIIYGIDEPEIGLHPHGQRHLLKSLEKLAEYSQVIITTHSNNLVDIYHLENLIRVDRYINQTKTHKIYLSDDERKRFEIHGDNLEETFFAKRILIVEGESETGFFPEASKKVIEDEVDYTFNLNSVSVINGKGNTIWYFIKMIKTLNVPFLVLIDDDKIRNDYVDFLNNMKGNNILNEAQYNQLSNLTNFNDRTETLKTYGIYVYSPFEQSLCTNAPEKILRKIIEAVNFVKQYWGYTQGIEDFISITDINDLRLRVQDYLSRNKRRRIGHAIAHFLDRNEYPQSYVDIIKFISKL